MNYHSYIRVCSDHTAIAEKLDWLLEDGLDEYEEHSLSVLGISRYPSLTDDMKIEQAFSAGFSEFEKKSRNKNYYVANCVCFVGFAKSVVTPEAKNLIDEHRSNKQLVMNWKTLLTNMLFDSVQVLNEYRRNVEGQTPTFPLIRSRYVDFVQLWHSSRQMMFGQVSGLAYADLEPDLSVAG